MKMFLRLTTKTGVLLLAFTLLCASGAVRHEDQANPKKNVLSFDRLPAIPDFSKKICWDLNRAWQKNTPLRRRYSLAAYWRFMPVGIPAETEPCYRMVPGSWRGANPAAAVRNSQGRAVAAFQGKKIDAFEEVEFFRTFFAPPEWRGKSLRLKCDYLHADSEVILNGRSLGKFGEASDFMVDCSLASAVAYGAENKLTLRLRSTSRRGEIRAGVLDALWLDVRPERGFGTPRVETRLSEKTMRIDFPDASPGLKGDLRLIIRDAATGEAVEKRTLPFRNRLVLDYVAPKLWDLEHPNLYFLETSFLGADGQVLDTEKIRFGFREFTVKGKDYLLNGKPIRLICASTCMTAIWECGYFTSPEAYRNRLLTLKRMRHNCCYVTRSEQSSVYDAADEVGFLMMPLAFILPYREQEKLKDDEALARVRKALEQAVKSERYRNHPSLAMFVTDIWFNLHPGSHNPEYFGVPRDVKQYPNYNPAGEFVPGSGADPNVSGMRLARQKRLEAINALHQEFFPGTLAITGGSGKVGPVYSTHLYHTWGAPVHELRAFCQRYSLNPSVPLFIGEMNIPYPLSFYYPILTPDQKRPMYYENAVRFLGNRAYRYPRVNGPMHSMLYETFEKRNNRVYLFVSSLYGEVISLVIRNTMSAWRFQGLNGLGPFGYAVNGKFLMAGVERKDRLKPVPDGFTSPWFEPEYLSRGANQPPHSHTGSPDMRPVAAAAEFLAAWNPVALDFFGADRDIWETDHAFFGGETVRKSVAVMNDLQKEITFRLRLFLRDSENNRINLLETTGKSASFSSTRIPVEFTLPEVSVRSEMKLFAELLPEGGERILRAFPLEVFPRTAAPKLKRKLFVFDPEGLASAQLKRWNLPFEPISDFSRIPDHSLLLVGRGAFSQSSSVPDLNELAGRGIRSLILEQDASTSMELMKVRERYAFSNAPEHPVLAGFKDRDFSLWRGSHSRMPAYRPGTTGQPWTDWGNRNMVAGTVFRRPTQGNYRALLVSGFDLFQTPLLEYSGGPGLWIGCQLEISERLGSDPVPTELFARMLARIDRRAVRERETVFLGGEKGKNLLGKLKVNFREIKDLSERSLGGANTLLIADPDFGLLEKYRFELNTFVHAGNRVVYLQCGETFSPAWLPFTLKLERKKFTNALASTRGGGLWLAGFHNNDFAYEKSYELPVFTGFPPHWDSFAPGVLLRAAHGEGEFVFCSVTPERFGKDYAAHKTARFLSALLTSAGVEIETKSPAYMVQSGARSCSLDLAQRAWQFALDPENVGRKEKWNEGATGSGKWITGQTADAREVRVGIPWEHFLGRAYDGIAWYRLEFEVPAELAKSKKLFFNVGCIDDLDEVYLNGIKIGSTGTDTPAYWQAPRMYAFDAALLKPGKNRLDIRVDDLRGEGGIRKLPCMLSNRPGAGGRAWNAPFLDSGERDYRYNPNVVRGY